MSYTLRTMVANNTIQNNRYLGDEYQVVLSDDNYEEFARHYERYFGKKHVKEGNEDGFNNDTYGFITASDGSQWIPMYKSQRNYIMTASGQTFSNLTWKP